MLVTCALLLVTPVHAQVATPSAATQPPVVFHPQSPQYANIVVVNLIHTFSCLAEGTSVIGSPCLEYRAGIPTQVEFLGDRGALGSVANLITALYETPPAKTSEYIAEMGKGLGIVKPVLAQVGGSGNQVLSPILTLWQISRNIAYAAMILIFIVIGFMIMFRTKINPQTVISAQAALPGLVIGLLLITFSYFLAAFLVDMTFVGTRVVAKVYENTVIEKGSVDKLLKDGNVIALFSDIMSPFNGQGRETVVNTTADTVEALKKDSTFGQIINNVSFLGGCLIGLQMAPDIKAEFKPFGIGVGIDVGKAAAKVASCTLGGGLVALLSNTPWAGGLIGLILYVVLTIALLIALFKLLFSLIISYISIIITTIFAPFYFLVASIPGRQEVASTWFKTLIANILVFPAVFAALVFAAYIIGIKTDHIRAVGNGLSFSGGTVPLLAGLSSDFLRIILAYGILLISPTIPDAVKEAFGVKTSPLAGAGLAAAGAGAGVVSSFAGRAFQPAAAERQAYQTALGRYRTGEIEQYPIAPRSPLNKILSGTWLQRDLTPEGVMTPRQRQEHEIVETRAGRRPTPTAPPPHVDDPTGGDTP